MPDHFDNHTLFGQGVNDTMCHLSLGITSSTINSKERTNTINGHGTVDVNLSLSSATYLTSTHQTVPSQLSLHQRVGEGRISRSNLRLPCGARSHSTYDSHPMQPQNPLNINIIVGNNSSININLLNNNPPYQYTKSTLASSSSMEPIRKNVIGTAPSYFKQPLSALASNQEPILGNNPNMSDSCQLIESCSPYTSSSVTALKSQALGTCIPHYRRETSCRPLRALPCQNIDLRNNSNLSFFNMLPRYLPHEKHRSFSGLPSSTMNPPKFKSGNEAFHEAELHSQRNLHTHLQSLPAATDQVRDQVHDCSSLNSRLLLSNFNAVSPTPPSNIMIGAQSNPVQAISPNHSVDPNPRARRRRNSTERYKSRPYTKYGPYTCPHCQDVFECGYRFAAHIKNHYKDESPAERKKRREGKIRKRDLCVAQSSSGITVIPGSLQFRLDALIFNHTENILQDRCAPLQAHDPCMILLELKQLLHHLFLDQQYEFCMYQ